MAIKTTNVTKNVGKAEMRVKSYENGPIFILGPVGNIDPKGNVICAGTKKLSLIFGRDEDGDNVLIELYRFLKENMSNIEFADVQKVAVEFAERVHNV